MLKAGAVRTATIDIIDHCLSRCTFCSNSTVLNSKRVMPFEKFKGIVESLPHLRRVNIGGGEPFAHRDLPKILSFSLLKGIHTDLSTSGLIWREDVVHVGKSGGQKFSLQINFPAASEQGFADVAMQHGKFALLVKNTERFIYSFGSDKVRLRITVCQGNLGEVEPVSRISSALGVPLYAELMLGAQGAIAKKLDENQVITLAFLVVSLKSSGRDVRFKNEFRATGCPALAYSYNIPLVPGACTAEIGTSAYFDASGQEMPCEFLKTSSKVPLK